MDKNFKISAIDPGFDHLFSLSERALAEMGAVKMMVDKHPGYPCRVSLKDAEIGEKVMLLPFKHHHTTSPYQASGPIFVRENVAKAELEINEIPKMISIRLLSLRAYTKQGMMMDAAVVKGKHLKEEIERMFSMEIVQYIDVHNAKPGCHNCRIERA